jgi:histidine triad (HIT) family protein
MLARLLFPLARSRGLGWLVGQLFTYMSFLLPVSRLRETATVIAFYHPRPAYPFHVLLVPKRPLANLNDITAQEADFLVELFQVVQSLVQEFGLEGRGYRLVCNGGKNQDVPHLHFHLIAGEGV